MDNLDHSFDFLWRDWPGATLFPQQVHYVGGEFVTGLEQIRSKTFGFIFHPRIKKKKKNVHASKLEYPCPGRHDSFKNV